MNWKNFLRKIGFALTLASLSLSIDGTQRILGWVLAGIIVLVSLMMFLKNMSQKPSWKSFIHWVEEGLDFTYLAFGLGLILIGIKILGSGWSLIGFLLFVAGVLFTGLAIGQFIGEGFSRTLKTNATIVIIIGFVCLIAGIVWLVLEWASIIQNPLLNAADPIVIILLGIIFVFFGFKKWRKSRTLL
jgi:hypothetical protein